MGGDALVTELSHFAAPFGFDADGRARVVEQDTVEHVASCVFNIASCPVGALVAAPDLGISDPMGLAIPIDTATLVAEIGEQEPRAVLIATESGSSLDSTIRTIQLQTSTRGGANA